MSITEPGSAAAVRGAHQAACGESLVQKDCLKNRSRFLSDLQKNYPLFAPLPPDQELLNFCSISYPQGESPKLETIVQKNP
jgi:hypothetical protein